MFFVGFCVSHYKRLHSFSIFDTVFSVLWWGVNARCGSTAVKKSQQETRSTEKNEASLNPERKSTTYHTAY